MSADRDHDAWLAWTTGMQARIEAAEAATETPIGGFLSCVHSAACRRAWGRATGHDGDAGWPWDWLGCGDCECWEGE